MTAIQEGLSSFTEFLATAYVVVQSGLFIASRPETTMHTTLRFAIVMACAVYHGFFSVTYHARLSLGIDTEPMDNEWRRRDQAAINVACIGYSFGISGTIWYGLLVLAVKYRHVIEIWRPTTTASRRRMHIFSGCIMYLSPILWNSHPLRFSTAVGSLVAGSICFACNRMLGGYGSVIFHLSLLPYHRAILAFIDAHGTLP